MLSREIVKLTRSNDRPGFHRGRNFFTRDSCNRAAAAFTKRCNYGWPVVAVVFLRPFFEDRQVDRERERERNGTGERSKLQVREPLGALFEDTDR